MTTNWMDEHDQELAAKAKAEIAEEDAAWNALTPEQQEAQAEARAARLEALYDSDDDDDEDEETCDDCDLPVDICCCSDDDEN